MGSQCSNVSFIHALDGSERRPKDGIVIFVHAFLDAIGWPIFVGLVCLYI